MEIKMWVATLCQTDENLFTLELNDYNELSPS